MPTDADRYAAAILRSGARPQWATVRTAAGFGEDVDRADRAFEALAARSFVVAGQGGPRLTAHGARWAARFAAARVAAA